MASPKIFDTLHHVCIVVKDLAASQAYYESIGIGPWHDFPDLLLFEGELSVPDRDGFFALQYRFANLGNVQLQLCEPPEGDTPQRRFLEEHGEGVFHLGFTVPDCDSAEDAGKAMGLEMFMRGRLPDRTGFTYFNTHPHGAGVTLEVRAAFSAPSTSDTSR